MSCRFLYSHSPALREACAGGFHFCQPHKRFRSIFWLTKFYLAWLDSAVVLLTVSTFHLLFLVRGMTRKQLLHYQYQMKLWYCQVVGDNIVTRP